MAIPFGVRLSCFYENKLNLNVQAKHIEYAWLCSHQKLPTCVLILVCLQQMLACMWLMCSKN